jgi:Na+/proline symporter
MEAIRFSPLDALIIALYCLVIVGVSVLFRATSFQEMFGENKKPGWLLLSASLLMITWSPMTDMMSMGIILESGYSSLWVLKDRFWLAGVPAILFASMWARLQVRTDNQLLRLRYSGASAVVLHAFRALYLSFFVIPFFGAFIILALRKFLEVLLSGQHLPVNVLLTLFVLIIVCKNSFRQKIRTDVVNAVVCLAAPFVICYFIHQHYGSFSALYTSLQTAFPHKINIIPSFSPTAEKSSLANFLVFFLVQWWSVHIIDDSDPNAQRHVQAKNGFFAFKALFLPILISSMMFLLISVIWDCGILEYNNLTATMIDPEAFYIAVAFKYLPDGFKALAAIAFLFSFATTLENIISWGGGLLTVDIIQQYLYPHGSDNQYRCLSFAMMLLVAAVSLTFAFNSEELFTLQKFIFSISAGVAPVFVLRWFWWRINAWTQISAMVSSLVYTLVFDRLYASHPGFKGAVDALGHAVLLDYYPLKLIILTCSVVATWLTVMYCTEPVAKAHLKKFHALTGAGGFWPREFGDNGYQLAQKTGLCLLFAAASILPYFFVWQIKFGNPAVAWLLLGAFVVLAGMVYRCMSILLRQPAARE